MFDQYVGWWNLNQTKGVSVLKHTRSLNLSFPFTVTWHLSLQMEIIHFGITFLAPDLSYFSMYLMTFLLYSILTLWPLFSMMSVYYLCAMDWRFKKNLLCCNISNLLRLCLPFVIQNKLGKKPWFCSTGYLFIINQIKRNNQSHLHMNLMKAYLYICDSPVRNVQPPKPWTYK